MAGSRSGIAGALIKFSLPLIGSGVLQQLYSWADAFIVGNVEGELALAAVGSTSTLVNFFITAITGFSLGLAILAAQKYGKQEAESISRVLSTFSIFLGGVFLVLAGLGIALTPSLLRLLHTTEDTVRLAEEYLRIVFAGVPFLAVYNVYSAVLRGLGNSKAAFYSVLLSSAVNVVLDIVFVYNFRMGVAGAAIATDIAQAGSFVTVFDAAWDSRKWAMDDISGHYQTLCRYGAGTVLLLSSGVFFKLTSPDSFSIHISTLSSSCDKLLYGMFSGGGSFMDRQDNKIKSIKHICAGLLAHVDAGKTTLSEDILYHTGVIRKPGRVDHRDTFFDTDSRERKRGITIFSKEASFKLGDKCFYLMDTPGHTDFSAEMERVLSVLDYAVLIISGPDGVQSHTRTLWRLLKRYELPALIFVNKMDMEGTDKSSIMKELRSELSESCVEFSKELINGYAAEGAFIKEAGAESAAIPEELLESIAMSSEELMEEYLEKGSISSASIIKAIKGRELYPCIFGSALRDEGVSELLSALAAFTDEMDFGDEFSARVFKITRDQRGNRLTHMKLTGGSIRVKDSIDIPAGSRKAGSGASEDPSAEDGSDSAETVSEKIEGIRLYNGERATELTEASAGMVVAISGLKHTYAGMGLGRTENDEKPLLVPLFEYALIPPFDVDRKQFYLMLKPLEDEIPELLLSYIPSNDEIHIRLMGDVQNEILTDLIEERYGVKVEFGEASVIYKETIADSVEGVGHFEPLRHYAEAHLLLEPGEPGSGIEAVDLMGEGRGLSGNYRRLILSHILEKEHLGVLTGSGLTDVRISLVAGKSHDKHTEGGDFREATYRAIRQGLMYAENVLLEPYYEYRIKLPSEYVGRAMTDIQRMSGSFEVETLSDRESLVTGKAPVSLMKNYNAELISYTKGLGSLSLSFCGYGKCHDSEAAIESMGYDPESDVENPTGSVFCAHGAGYYVPWNEVYDMMHLPFATDVMRKRGISSSSYVSNADDPISSDVIAGAHYAGASGTDADASAAGGSGASGRASMSSRSSGGQGSSRDGAISVRAMKMIRSSWAYSAGPSDLRRASVIRIRRTTRPCFAVRAQEARRNGAAEELRKERQQTRGKPRHLILWI